MNGRKLLTALSAALFLTVATAHAHERATAQIHATLRPQAAPQRVSQRAPQTRGGQRRRRPVAAAAPAPGATGQEAATVKAQEPELKLTEAEQTLARNSKAAILAAGISEAYFDAHFKLVKVFNTTGDRRVVWRFRVGEYETSVVDSVGFYTDERGRRVNIHSVTAMLSSAHDIKRLISRRQAERLMRACIGEFTNPTVLYGGEQRAGAALVFTATAVAKRERRDRREEREEREREARQRREREAARAGKTHQMDTIEEEDEGGPPLVVGSINLETGRCTKGRLLAGPDPGSSRRGGF